MILAAGSDKDGDDQAQRRAGTTEENVGIKHRLGPHMEALTRRQRGFNGAVLLIGCDVFQCPWRHNAAIERRQRQRPVYAEEPQQRGENNVCPAYHGTH